MVWTGVLTWVQCVYRNGPTLSKWDYLWKQEDFRHNAMCMVFRIPNWDYPQQRVVNHTCGKLQMMKQEESRSRASGDTAGGLFQGLALVSHQAAGVHGQLNRQREGSLVIIRAYRVLYILWSEHKEESGMSSYDCMTKRQRQMVAQAWGNPGI